MPISTERRALSELLGLLYEGLALPERWPDFLSEVARRLRCEKSAIVFHDWRKQRTIMDFCVGLPEDATREYNAYYGMKDPISATLLKAAQRNGLWHGLARAVVSEAEYRKSEFYQGWGLKHGVFHAVVGFASYDGGSGASLTVCRPERAGPLRQDAIDVIGLLVPHLRRVFQVHARLNVLRSSAEGAHATLEKFGTAVIAIAGDGSVVSMNRRAQGLLSRDDGLALRRGRLVTTELSQSAEWEQLVSSAALTGAGLGASLGGSMLVQRRRTSQPLPVMVMPFHSSHLLMQDHPCALVFINDPAERPASRASLLLALYRLTPSECRLADLILQGADLRKVAVRLRLTIHTARFMLKSIFRKTGTHRQSELMRLLMSLPGEGQPPG